MLVSCLQFRVLFVMQCEISDVVCAVMAGSNRCMVGSNWLALLGSLFCLPTVGYDFLLACLVY
jgi:hypothetical protein